MTFRDRTHAGRLLAISLDAYRAERPVVLGLARGGVPVAVEVARLLEAELDVLVVRKIGAPGSPDCAVGAIAEGGAVYVGLSRLITSRLGLASPSRGVRDRGDPGRAPASRGLRCS